MPTSPSGGNTGGSGGAQPTPSAASGATAAPSPGATAATPSGTTAAPSPSTSAPRPGSSFRRPKFWVGGFAQGDEIKRHRAAVFGAGIGGLTVAQELAERGFKVHVFEKQSRTLAGGLASSQWHVGDRIPAMLGAMYPDIDLDAEFALPAEHGFRFFPSFYVHVVETMRRIPIWDRQQLDVASLISFPSAKPDDRLVCDIREALTTADNAVRAAAAAAAAADPNTILNVVSRILALAEFRGQVDFFRPPLVTASNLVATNKTAMVFDDGRVLAYDRRVPRSQLGSFAGSFLLELFGLGHEVRDMALMSTRMLQYLTSCRERRLAQYEKMTFWDFMQADRLSPTLQAQLGRFTRLLMAMDARRGEARTVLSVLVRMLLDQGSAGMSTDCVLNGPTTERWIVPWVRHLEANLGVTFHWCSELTRFELDANGKLADAWVKRACMPDATEYRLTDFLLQEHPAPPDHTPPPPEDPGIHDRGVPYVSSSNDSTGHSKYDPQEWNYFVTDLPVRALWRVFEKSPGLLDADEKETAARPARCFPRDNPDPPLRAISHLVGDECNPWMAGMQFYLSDPMDLGVPGHLNFVDSKWALTAIVQSQFWGPDFVDRYGHSVVRAILSVDIAEFDVPGELDVPGEPVPLTLRQLATKSQTIAASGAADAATKQREISDAIAAEVWHQMAKGLQKWDVRLPEPEKTTMRTKAGKTVEFPIPLPYLDHHIDWTLCGCSVICKPRGFAQGDCVDNELSAPAYFISTPTPGATAPGRCRATTTARRDIASDWGACPPIQSRRACSSPASTRRRSRASTPWRRPTIGAPRRQRSDRSPPGLARGQQDPRRQEPLRDLQDLAARGARARGLRVRQAGRQAPVRARRSARDRDQGSGQDRGLPVQDLRRLEPGLLARAAGGKVQGGAVDAHRVRSLRPVLVGA